MLVNFSKVKDTFFAVDFAPLLGGNRFPKDISRIVFYYSLLEDIGCWIGNKYFLDYPVREECEFLRSLERDLEMDISTLNELLIRSGAVVSGSYLLSHLFTGGPKNSWKASDIDIFVLDSACDERIKTPIDRFLENYNYRYDGQLDPEVRNEFIKQKKLRYPREFEVRNIYSGPTPPGTRFDFNGWAFRSDSNNFNWAITCEGYQQLNGMIGQRKYHLKNINVDVVHVDSKMFESSKDFIIDTFDFKFLKNTWDGKSLSIFEPESLITKKSVYNCPKHYFSTGRMCRLPANNFMTHEGANPQVVFLEDLEERRRKLYEGRGFVTE